MYLVANRFMQAKPEANNEKKKGNILNLIYEKKTFVCIANNFLFNDTRMSRRRDFTWFFS